MPLGIIKQRGILNATLNFMETPNVKFVEAQVDSNERFPIGFALTDVLGW
jgi:hypothetical protein